MAGAANDPAAQAAACRLLSEGSAELTRLRRVRGASRRTYRRMARAAAVMVAAAAMLGLGAVPSSAAPPQFVPGFLAANPIPNVDYSNSPAMADIDGDGDLDAFLGVSTGNIYFFENTGSAAAPAFAAPTVNPFGLADVGVQSAPTFVDVDGDGDLDAFIGESNGDIFFFENTGTVSVPAFAPAATNPFGLVGVGAASKPAFADIDGDGDLDAFVGNSVGDTIFFENTGTVSVPAFAAAATNSFGLTGVFLNSSPTFADIDGDGDLDAFIGEALGGNTIFFENTGTALAPAFAPAVTNPFGIIPFGVVGAPTFADIDGDGDLDMIIGNGFGFTLLLENTGSAFAPAFAVPAANPFGLADVCNFSAPTFADIDGDGDFDAFVGESCSIGIEFFENTGSALAPAFAPAVLNPFGLTSVGYYGGARPAFADIDGDGDLDAFIGGGAYYGNTYFFENTGSPALPAFAPAVINPFGLTTVSGFNPSPTLADIDGDGDIDAFIGTGYGDTYFFENTGSPASPAFAPAVTNPFGLTSVGYSIAPTFADIDGDGDLDAFIGELGGNTFFFENTGSAVAPSFAAAVVNPFGLADVGYYSVLAFADIDGDGDIDAFIGENSGRTFFFENLAAGPPPTPTATATAAATPTPPPSGVPCPPAPDACTEGFTKALLAVKEKQAGKEKVLAKFIKGPALTQNDFGNPLNPAGTEYRLCIYGDDDALAGELVVDRAGDTCGTKPCWKPIGQAPPTGKGFAYKDTATDADGVGIIKLKGGDAGKSLLLVKAANNASKAQSNLPTGISAALQGDAAATVQLRTSDAGCFSVEVADVKKADTDFFKAKK